RHSHRGKSRCHRQLAIVVAIHDGKAAENRHSFRRLTAHHCTCLCLRASWARHGRSLVHVGVVAAVSRGGPTEGSGETLMEKRVPHACGEVGRIDTSTRKNTFPCRQ